MSVIDRVNPRELGSRLKAARALAKMTQEVAASNLGVARTTIVAMESGERQVRPTELSKLAELYDVSLSSLVRNSEARFDLVPQFRRSSSANVDSELSQAAAKKLQELVEMAVDLERRLGRIEQRIIFPEYRINRAGWVDQAEDLAAEVRQRVGVGTGAIPDIFVIAEANLDLRVFFQKLDSKVAGLFAYNERLGGCILINAVHPYQRQIWTCAHEIAHYLCDRRTVDVVWWGTERPSLSERFANRFAGAFLMPASSLRSRYAEIREESGRFSPIHLGYLARSFRVSIEAVARRLEQLGLLPAGTYDSLITRGFSAKAIGEALGLEPDERPLQTPPKLAALAVEAHERELLTEGQATELLGIDRVSLRRLSESLGVARAFFEEVPDGK